MSVLARASRSRAPYRVLALRLAAVTLLLPPVALAAQGVATPQPAAQSQSGRLKSDLRNLITAQEARYADRGAYAPSLDALGPQAYRASQGVTIEIVHFTPNGYGAVARAEGFAGTCVVHVGLAADSAPSTQQEQKRFPEGDPACDGDGIDARSRWAAAAEMGAHRFLARVAKLQEQHFGRTGSYATAVSALPGVTVPATLTVTIDAQVHPQLGAAFVATAVDARHPGQSCVVRSGNGRFGAGALTVGERKPARVELQVVCDTFK